MKISKEQFEKIILEEVYAELEREMIEEGIFDDALEKGKSLFRKKRNDSGELDRMIRQKHAQDRIKDVGSYQRMQQKDSAEAKRLDLLKWFDARLKKYRDQKLALVTNYIDEVRRKKDTFQAGSKSEATHLLRDYDNYLELIGNNTFYPENTFLARALKLLGK